MENIYQSNLKLLEQKNALMNFKLRDCAGIKSNIFGDGLLEAEDEVVFVYRLVSLRSLKHLLECLQIKQLRVIIFERSLEEVAYLMTFKEMGDLLQCDSFQWYLLEDLTEELFLKLAWETVFLKKRFLTAVIDENFTRFKQKMSAIVDGVFLSASEYRDYGVKVANNFYQNLSFIRGSGELASLKLEGIPIVICGAGPSLYHQMDLLKDLQHKALIFSGGSCLSALIQQGIKPHLVALVDPDSTAHLGLGSQVYEIPIIYQMRLCHEVLQNIHGQKILSKSSQEHLMENYVLEKLGVSHSILESGWHVGNFMATVAAEMGCHPIILVGMDMVYKGDVEYVEGVYLTEEKIKVEAPCLTMQGAKAFSRKDLLMGRNFFSELLTRYPKSYFINATLEGLPIANMEHRCLLDVTASFPTQDIEGMLHSKLQILEKVSINQDAIESCLATLKESFSVSERYLNEILIKLETNSLHQKDEESTKALSQIALEEIELEEEVAYKNCLEPLWHVWKWMIFRRDQNKVTTVTGKVQQTVFYLDVVRQYKLLLK